LPLGQNKPAEAMALVRSPTISPGSLSKDQLPRCVITCSLNRRMWSTMSSMAPASSADTFAGAASHSASDTRKSEGSTSTLSNVRNASHTAASPRSRTSHTRAAICSRSADVITLFRSRSTNASRSDADMVDHSNMRRIGPRDMGSGYRHHFGATA